MSAIGSLLDHWARYHPDKTAVLCGGERISFARHQQRVRTCAAALHTMGLQRGDAVAVFMGNRIELLELYRACALLGLVMVPVSPLLQAPGVAMVLDDAQIKAVFAQGSLLPVLDTLRPQFPGIGAERWISVDVADESYPRYADLLASAPPPEAVADIDPDVPFNIMYSSGTTGTPKGIVLTHRIRMAYALQLGAALAVRTDSVVMHSGSLVFNGSFTTLMPAWLQGCTYILEAQFDAERFLDTVRREAVTHVMMVPSQVAAMLAAPNFSVEALGSLKMLCSVGAPLPHEHRQRLLELLPGAVYELYGLTEGFATLLDGADAAAHPGSVGIPLPLHELRIVDDALQEVPAGTVGEIMGRGPILMPGYHRQPELTRTAIVDGWLRTGDLGFVDEAGYLHLVDRQKDLIISGGVNVYPRDIEEVIARHPAVREAAVFGVPHPRWGESPIAAVLLKAGAVIEADTLREWVNANVAARFQRIAGLRIHQDFPRNAAGKTLKRELRASHLSHGA